MIDTGKPSEGNSDMARWEVFAQDFLELYKLARPNGNGLGLNIWVNIQLADSALINRFLDYQAFADSKKIKNEASVVFMGRFMNTDEMKGGKRALKIRKFVKTDPNNAFHDQDLKYQTVEDYIEDDGTIYYLLFVPKNRRGQDNKTGLDVLVLRCNFNSNTFWEVGWTKVPKDI